MSIQDNKTLARREFEELWVKGNAAAADELHAPDVVDHMRGPGQAPGREGIKQAAALQHRALPAEGTIHGMIAEGDTVARWETFRGTHEGELLGLPATHKPFTMTAIDVLRIVDGKIVEVWHQEDLLGLMQQLGAVPPPSAGPG
jgi:steroid delta-isomerase-like uncharacterized protein